jgi:phage shock protein PspC (stress-responsive transcriptional regulator)
MVADRRYRRLYKSRYDRVIAGVAGGLAEYFDLDPTLVRLLFVIAALFGGSGLIAYLVALIVIPEAPEGLIVQPKEDPAGADVPDEAGQETEVRRPARDRSWLGGLILILVGTYFLIREFFPWLGIDHLWPVIPIGVGVALILSSVRR